MMNIFTLFLFPKVQIFGPPPLPMFYFLIALDLGVNRSVLGPFF
jgi:hypothetical protein